MGPLSATWSAIEEAARRQAPAGLWLRLPILAWMAWLALDLATHAAATSILGALDLGVHEAGHLVTRPFGAWLSVAAGSGFQVLAPPVAALVLWRQGEAFGLAFCLSWWGESLHGLANYIGDARAQELPLVSVGGGEVIHDWWWILDHLGLLPWDTTLAGLVRVVAVVALLGGVAAGVRLLWVMGGGVKAG